MPPSPQLNPAIVGALEIALSDATRGGVYAVGKEEIAFALGNLIGRRIRDEEMILVMELLPKKPFCVSNGDGTYQYARNRRQALAIALAVQNN